MTVKQLRDQLNKLPGNNIAFIEMGGRAYEIHGLQSCPSMHFSIVKTDEQDSHHPKEGKKRSKSRTNKTSKERRS